MHNLPFFQPVGKPGEFSSDTEYNYTLKNKQEQWLSSHFLGTAECSILKVSGGFVSCTSSPLRGLCPKPARGDLTTTVGAWCIMSQAKPVSSLKN